MYGMKITRIFTALSTLLIVSSAGAQIGLQSGLEFNAKPNRCVALRKGQTCYQRVLLRFKAPETGNYCLLVEDRAEPVHCWSNVTFGRYRYEVESSKNVKFYLHNSEGRVAETDVSIAWVYKNRSSRRTSWRIF